MNTKSLERSKTITKIVTYGTLIIGSIVMVFPFVWMILTSSKTVSESMQVPPDTSQPNWDKRRSRKFSLGNTVKDRFFMGALLSVGNEDGGSFVKIIS